MHLFGLPKFFVCYRRTDRPAHALSIGLYLQHELGERNVFMDIETLQAGEPFESVIRRYLRRCRVLIVVIGPDWLHCCDDKGCRRLDDPNDWVKSEIVEAFRQKMKVVPVLVHNAQLPTASELPPELRKLAELQTSRVSIAKFRSDMQGIVQQICGNVRQRLRALRYAAVGGATAVACWAGTVTLAMPQLTLLLSNSEIPITIPGISDPEQLIAAWKRGPDDTVGRSAADQLKALDYKLTGTPKDAVAWSRPAAHVSSRKPFRDCDGCPTMVRLPVGTFRMGSTPDDKFKQAFDETAHAQTIKHTIAISQTEVTVGEFAEFTRDTRQLFAWNCDSKSVDRFDPPGDKHLPVTCVSYEDATDYVKWLSKLTGRRYRLPTEAEWEFAARAGSETSMPKLETERQTIASGSALCAHANALHARTFWSGATCRGEIALAPVGQRVANAFMLHDMLGNAAEWVADCYHQDYEGKPAEQRADGALPWDDSKCAPVIGRRGGPYGIVRGGQWKSMEREVRVAARERHERQIRSPEVGLRVVRQLD